MKTKMTLAAALAAAICTAADDGMFPFVPSYDSPDNVVNMSHLLAAPAGKDGRIRVEGGHFVNDKGRVKLHATNLTGPANFPTHEEADRLAARLARFGINCVRLHYFDNSYGTFMLPKEQGILDESGETRRKLDPERRDRQDYLIAQFKKRGIYVNVNLHVARHLGPADGIPHGATDRNKGFNQFYPPLIALQKEYAKELLSHVNPYTGMSYLKDPVVAVVERNNEEGRGETACHRLDSSSTITLPLPITMPAIDRTGGAEGLVPWEGLHAAIAHPHNHYCRIGAIAVGGDDCQRVHASKGVNHSCNRRCSHYCVTQ